MKYQVEILPNTVDNADGWRLRLIEDGEQVGEVGFLIPGDECGSESALQAAYFNAQKEAEIWLESKYRYNAPRDRVYVIPTVLVFTGFLFALFAILLFSEFLSPLMLRIMHS